MVICLFLIIVLLYAIKNRLCKITSDMEMSAAFYRI